MARPQPAWQEIGPECLDWVEWVFVSPDGIKCRRCGGWSHSQPLFPVLYSRIPRNVHLFFHDGLPLTRCRLPIPLGRADRHRRTDQQEKSRKG